MGISDTVAIELDGPGEAPTELVVEQPYLVRIVAHKAQGEHKVRMRFVDEHDRYLPGEFNSTVHADGHDAWDFAGKAPLTLAPPRNGDFRLLIEVDNQLIGWIPLKTTLMRTTRRES